MGKIESLEEWSVKNIVAALLVPIFTQTSAGLDYNTPYIAPAGKEDHQGAVSYQSSKMNRVCLAIILLISLIASSECASKVIELTTQTFEHQTQASTGQVRA